MTDVELAEELVKRLNKLCENPDIRDDVSLLLKLHIPCSTTTGDHPSIQVTSGPSLGFLGLLNGLVGVIPDGRFTNWGHIAANFDDDGNLQNFTRLSE